MANICIIPARGGSKRIPRKNIKPFLGKPIIAYSIEAALDSKLFDEVIVSTDDAEIAEVAKEYGAKIPFIRSVKNSDDYSGTGDVCLEVLDYYKEQSLCFDSICCLYPTAPFVSEKTLINGYNKLFEFDEIDCVISLGQFSSPIERSYKMLDSGLIKFNFSQFEKMRSQDLPHNYYDAGQFYWFYPDTFYRLQNKNSFGENKAGIILDEIQIQDIDNPSDWEIAEFKFTFIKNYIKNEK